MKQVTTKAVRDVIRAEIKSEEEGIKMYYLLFELLRPFDNQPITKRIETALKKAMPDYFIVMDTSCGMYHINVHEKDANGRPIFREGKKSFLIGYDTRPVFYLESKEGYGNDYGLRGFDYYSRCWGEAAEKRNESRKEALNHAAQIAGSIRKLIKARDDLKELTGSFKWSIEYILAETFNYNLNGYK